MNNDFQNNSKASQAKPAEKARSQIENGPEDLLYASSPAQNLSISSPMHSPTSSDRAATPALNIVDESFSGQLSPSTPTEGLSARSRVISQSYTKLTPTSYTLPIIDPIDEMSTSENSSDLGRASQDLGRARTRTRSVSRQNSK